MLDNLSDVEHNDAIRKSTNEVQDTQHAYIETLKFHNENYIQEISSYKSFIQSLNRNRLISYRNRNWGKLLIVIFGIINMYFLGNDTIDTFTSKIVMFFVMFGMIAKIYII